MSIDHLPMPPAEYRPDKAGECSRFETPEFCYAEDIKRACALRFHNTDFKSKIDWDAQHLANILHDNHVDEPTLASSRSMRDQRIRVIGAMWHHVAFEGMTARVATISPKSWRLSPADLVALNPRTLLNRLRSDLYKVGTSSSDCWMIGIMHGEFEKTSQMFQTHMHVIANPKMIEMIDRLRRLPNYSGSSAKGIDRTAVYHPIRVERRELSDLPTPLTYLAKSYWTARAQFESVDGKLRLPRVKTRIPEPYHSMLLLWLHQWKLSDMTLMMGLKATKAGLIRTLSCTD